MLMTIVLIMIEALADIKNNRKELKMLYETTIIARPGFNQKQAEELVKKHSEIIAEKGGEIVKIYYCGLKSLAYKIEGSRNGHYLVLHTKAPSAALNEMETSLKFDTNILRYLSVKVDQKEQLDANSINHLSEYEGYWDIVNRKENSSSHYNRTPRLSQTSEEASSKDAAPKAPEATEEENKQ